MFKAIRKQGKNAPPLRDAAGRPQPRNKPRPGNRPYIFKDMQDFEVQTDWRLSEPFMAEWLEISTDGRVTVKANGSGYAWDGCTPKWSLFDLAIIGVPDGHIDVRSMKPFTYRASMVHDALYQYLDSVPVTKAAIDRLFFRMLGDFRPRHLYYFMVRHFGGRGIVQHGLPPD